MRFSPARNTHFRKTGVSPRRNARFADSDVHIPSLWFFGRHAFSAHVSLALYCASKLQEPRQHPPPCKNTWFRMRFALLLRRCWWMVLPSCLGHTSGPQGLARTPRRMPYEFCESLVLVSLCYFAGWNFGNHFGTLVSYGTHDCMCVSV